MADRMQSFVDLLSPNLSTSLKNGVVRHVASLPMTDPFEVDPAAYPMMRFEEPVNRVELRSALAEIFAKALTWRLKSHFDFYSEYMFSFASFQQPYQSEHKHCNSRSPNFGEYDHVMLPYIPSVWRRHRERMADDFDEFKLISHGMVL
jgi:hypothetical protein